MTDSPSPQPPAPAPRRAWQQLRASDLRAAARLATQATTGVTHIVEGVHQSVHASLGLRGSAPGRTGGLTGLVYRGVRGTTRWIDAGLQAALLRLEPWLERVLRAAPGEVDVEREAVLSALNGVLGDRLQADDNPLALPMLLRQQGQPLDPLALHAAGQASGKLLLLVHGLCMNDLQWTQGGHDHGAHLARTLGYTPVYLRYNSGRHVSDNARDLAERLEALLAAWPVPVQEFSAIGHSMGGLVLRGAVHWARGQRQRWPAQLRRLVFLGTPHLGAPLERAGHGIDLLLASNPYSRPFVHLARLRSAGITDLRHGHVRESDWRAPDRRAAPVPLPAGVACYAVAAALAERHCGLADRLLGDGLVPLNSALGRHDTPARGLAFPPAHCHVAWQLGHLALLGDAAVADRLVQWLGAN